MLFVNRQILINIDSFISQLNWNIQTDGIFMPNIPYLYLKCLSLKIKKKLGIPGFVNTQYIYKHIIIHLLLFISLICLYINEIAIIY